MACNSVFCTAGPGREHPGKVSAEQRQEHSVSSALLSKLFFSPHCRFSLCTPADEAAGMTALQAERRQPELTNQTARPWGRSSRGSAEGRFLSVNAHLFIGLPVFRCQTGFSGFHYVAIFSADIAFNSTVATWLRRPVWFFTCQHCGFHCDSNKRLAPARPARLIPSFQPALEY